MLFDYSNYSPNKQGWGTKRFKPALLDRLYKHIQKTDTCWIWTGSKSGGYGNTAVNGKAQRVHRIMWTLYNGPIPKGMCVLHRCDNPPCVRPDHLFLGTKMDNVSDMIAKGRDRFVKPSALHYRAKLTQADIEYIREKLSGPRKRGDGVALAKQFGVTAATICSIIKNRTWLNK